MCVFFVVFRPRRHCFWKGIYYLYPYNYININFEASDRIAILPTEIFRVFLNYHIRIQIRRSQCYHNYWETHFPVCVVSLLRVRRCTSSKYLRGPTGNKNWHSQGFRSVVFWRFFNQFLIFMFCLFSNIIINL